MEIVSQNAINTIITSSLEFQLYHDLALLTRIDYIKWVSETIIIIQMARDVPHSNNNNISIAKNKIIYDGIHPGPIFLGWWSGWAKEALLIGQHHCFQNLEYYFTNLLLYFLLCTLQR